MSERTRRIEELIRQEIGQMIVQGDLADPRIGFVTVTGAEVTRDLRNARVYVSVLGDQTAQKETLAALNHAGQHIRAEIGRRARLRYSPELIFKLDLSAQIGDRVDKALKEGGKRRLQRYLPELEDAVRLITTSQSMAIFAHRKPDGDAVGSLLGLYLALRGLEKQVVPVLPATVPRVYEWLPGAADVRLEPPLGAYDLAIVLDCENSARLDHLEDALLAASRVLNIDHHQGNSGFGDTAVLEFEAAATGEIVYQLLQMLGVEFTPEIATNLYCAISTDCGSFQFSNVTQRTMEIAGSLVGFGADVERVAQRVYHNVTLSSLKLLGVALSKIVMVEDGAVATTHLTLGDFEQCQASREETEGIVNHLRDIDGVRLAVLLVEDGPNEVGISARAVQGLDASELTRQFGGGGHRAAAGGTFQGHLADALEQVVYAARELVRRSSGA
jgi:phosphoesterase RecJ-like protein